MSYQMIQLQPRDAERYAQLRHRMLTGAPWAFASDVDTDRGLDLANMRSSLGGDLYTILGAERGDDLVAAVGVIGSDRAKHAHRASIWGMWVDVKHRGRGLSKLLLRGAILEAWSWGVDFIDLGVSERARAARQLYASHGFVEWGVQPEALDVDGERFDESFMTLRTPGVAERRVRESLFRTRGTPEETAMLPDLERLIPDVLADQQNPPTVDGFSDVEVHSTNDCWQLTANAYLLPDGRARAEVKLHHDEGWLTAFSISLGGVSVASGSSSANP